MNQSDVSTPRPLIRYLLTATAIALALYIAWTAVRPVAPARLSELPNPHLAPAEVVRIQVAALRQGSESREGIAVAFRFASPSNRARTGPITHFASMIRSDTYMPLLDNVSVEYGRTLTRADRSYTALIVTDRRGVSSGYMWVLSRQGPGSCEACWMTESVMPIGDMQSLRFA